jgi:hypothetical protein
VTKKKTRADAHLKAAPAPTPAPTPVKASAIFGQVVAVMKRGLFTGEDTRVAAEAILFLEQVAQGEKSAEEQRDQASVEVKSPEEAKSDG